MKKSTFSIRFLLQPNLEVICKISGGTLTGVEKPLNTDVCSSIITLYPPPLLLMRMQNFWKRATYNREVCIT